MHDGVNAFTEFNRPALAYALPPPLLRPFSMQMLSQKLFRGVMGFAKSQSGQGRGREEIFSIILTFPWRHGFRSRHCDGINCKSRPNAEIGTGCDNVKNNEYFDDYMLLEVRGIPPYDGMLRPRGVFLIDAVYVTRTVRLLLKTKC